MTVKPLRSAFDTNVFVSALLSPGSIAAQAFKRARVFGVFLYSMAILVELQEVLSRPKFIALRSTARVEELLASLEEKGERVTVQHRIDECRDPKDNMLLELALSGNADILVTGDNDLLALHPWRGIAILTPRQYLDL